MDEGERESMSRGDSYTDVSSDVDVLSLAAGSEMAACCPFRYVLIERWLADEKIGKERGRRRRQTAFSLDEAKGGGPGWVEQGRMHARNYAIQVSGMSSLTDVREGRLFTSFHKFAD